MKTLIVICALSCFLPQGTRPVSGGGSPLFLSFVRAQNENGLAAALTYFPPEVRRAVEQRLAAKRAYRSRVTTPPGAVFEAGIMWGRRHEAESALVALTNTPGVEDEAETVAKAAPFAYEWEGYPDGPMAEATYFANYLTAHPQTPLAPALDLFALDLYRCAFEAAGRTIGEYQEPRFKDQTRGIQQRAAAAYVAAWQRLQRNSDVVVRAVATDIDEQSFIYVGGQGHPRTVK